MKKREAVISYTEYSGLSELPADERVLTEEAVKAAAGAYAPYSQLKVGAAIMLDDGTIVRGANVENAAFPSGSCAEKTALSYMVANHGDQRATAIAVASLKDDILNDDPLPPCGNCRQMLIEEEIRSNSPIKVILIGKSNIIVIENSHLLLPLSFSGNNLRK